MGLWGEVLREGFGSMVMRKVGKYEVGRTIGEGTFAKVKFAQNTETGESVAMKVLDRQTVLKHKMVEQVGVFGGRVYILKWRYWRTWFPFRTVLVP